MSPLLHLSLQNYFAVPLYEFFDGVFLSIHQTKYNCAMLSTLALHLQLRMHTKRTSTRQTAKKREEKRRRQDRRRQLNNCKCHYHLRIPFTNADKNNKLTNGRNVHSPPSFSSLSDEEANLLSYMKNLFEGNTDCVTPPPKRSSAVLQFHSDSPSVLHGFTVYRKPRDSSSRPLHPASRPGNSPFSINTRKNMYF